MPDQLTSYQWFAAILRGQTPSFSDLGTCVSEDKIWQIGLDNGVLALVNHNFANSELRDLIPESFNANLQKYGINAAATELGLEHELRQSLALITNSNIPFLLMKGTPLAYTHYPQTYLRSRCDTDIIFANRDDADKAWQQLNYRGYHRPNAVSGKFVSHEFCCYKKDKTGVVHTLDMHWKLSNKQFFARMFSFTELADSSTPIPELGEQVRALGSVHALLLACMHRIAHKPEKMENRLIWLYDIHLLATKFSNQQWLNFVTLAIDKELCGISLDGIQQTVMTFGTVIPEEIVSQLKEGASHEKHTTKIGESRLSMEISNLRALPGLKERVGLIRERVFPNVNYMLKKYKTQHRALLPYLYLKRAVGGVYKVFKS